MKTNFRFGLAVAVLVALAACLYPTSGVMAAATITIQSNDAPDEGFNDPTPWTPTGGNPATTLGQARLNAAQYAADQWAGCLVSDVTIVVRVQMDPHDCDSTMAVLGWAGTTTLHRDFAGAPLAETWYTQALANALTGVDLWPSAPDIDATFNSNIDGNPDCLKGANWYYGLDGNPPAGDIDFVTVVMHEICHGLGFRSFVTLSNGKKFDGKNDAFMVHLDQFNARPTDYPAMTDQQRYIASGSDPNLRWTGDRVAGARSAVPVIGGIRGGYIRNHAPRVREPGKSVSHFSTEVSPDELMEPNYTGPNHDPSLGLFLLADLGWTLDTTCVPCMPDGTTFATLDTTSTCRGQDVWGIRVGLTNLGPGGNAFDVNATLRNYPSWITVPDPDCAYGDIAFNESNDGSPDVFLIDVSNWPDTLQVTPDSIVVSVTFDVDLELTWQDICGINHFQRSTLRLFPVQKSWRTGLTMADTAATVSRTDTEWAVRFFVTNNGPAELLNLNATMTQSDPNVTITDPDCFYGDMAPGDVTDGDPDQFLMDLSAFTGQSFLVTVQLTWEDVCGNSYTRSVVQRLNPPDPSFYTPVAFARVNAARVDDDIEIQWNVSADEPINGFNVYRRDGDQNSEVRVNERGPLGPSQRNYVDSDVVPGESYSYSVAAIMSDGTEQRSPFVIASLQAYVNRLDQNHPNPFNPTTQIGYQVAASEGRVELKIYDVSGALVATLVDGIQSAGAYSVPWNGTNSEGEAVSTGVYFYRLTVGNFVQTRRMVLLK